MDFPPVTPYLLVIAPANDYQNPDIPTRAVIEKINDAATAFDLLPVSITSEDPNWKRSKKELRRGRAMQRCVIAGAAAGIVVDGFNQVADRCAVREAVSHRLPLQFIAVNPADLDRITPGSGEADWLVPGSLDTEGIVTRWLHEIRSAFNCHLEITNTSLLRVSRPLRDHLAQNDFARRARVEMGSNLRASRERAGMSQAQMLNHLPLFSVSELNWIEQGKYPLSDADSFTIARAISHLEPRLPRDWLQKLGERVAIFFGKSGLPEGHIERFREAVRHMLRPGALPTDSELKLLYLEWIQNQA